MKLDKPEELKRLKPNWKANNQFKFLFSLARELKKTVFELCETLSIEEMIGWAAYFELENEEFRKEEQQAQKNNAIKRRKR